MSEQTVGWVLHALEPDEELAAIEHLGSCAACRRTAAEVSEITSGLAEAVEQRDPPPGLRASIVEQAGRTPQNRPVRPVQPHPDREERQLPARVGPPSTPARHRSTAGAGPDDGRPAGRPASSRFLARRGRKLMAAVVAVLVLAGGGGLVAYAQQLRTERDASIAQSRDIFDMVARFDRPGTQHAFLSTAPDTQPVAAVVVDGDQRSVLAVGLTANSVDEQTYVLWGLNGDAAPKPVGTFDVRPTPDRPVSVGSASGGSFTQYAISLERGRVAPASPSSVIASGLVET